MTYSIPKGVFDLLPSPAQPSEQWKKIHKWQFLFEKMRKLSKEYGFEEIQTPIFEKTELFLRSIGQETDIVSKEMYTFLDKAERSLTLRPECTASVMRAFIEKKLYNESYLHKLFYLGPMFRYERQQAGRYRQFYQFGVEIIGNECAEQDAELLDFLATFFQSLKIKNLVIHLNSIGNEQCRIDFREALVRYLTPFKDKLSVESQKRLEKNPLRILDTKNKEDQKILENAPCILHFLEPDSKEHFEQLQKWLQIFKIPYVVNPKLVRGLDYYNRTVFEIVCGELGAQDTLAAGGRYDSLVKNMGGPATPAVGFALGIERLIQVMDAQNCPLGERLNPKILFIPLGEPAKEVCFELLKQARLHHLPSEMDFSGKKLKQVMKYAHKREIPFVCILGEDELSQGQIKVKNMDSGHEEQLCVESWIDYFKKQKWFR